MPRHRSSEPTLSYGLAENRTGWAGFRARHMLPPLWHYLLAGVLLVLALAFSIVSALDLFQPAISGVFIAERCEERPRGGCASYGTWISDDGSIVKHDIQLDGGWGPDVVTVAVYRPTGILNDEDANIVHTPFAETLSYGLPWLPVPAVLIWTIRTTVAARSRPRR